LRSQILGVLQLLPQAVAFTIAPRAQDSTGHLRDTFPLNLSGPWHGSLSKIVGGD
jgi:hypothetical protein